MLRGRKGQDEAKSGKAPTGMSDADFKLQVGIVLDALGSVLTQYGKHGFGTDVLEADELRRQMHDWMMHVTIGAPQPGSDASQPVGGILARDWNGLVRHFGNVRRDEAAFVGRSMGDLRDSIWAFVRAFHQFVTDEQDENRVVKEAFERLRAAVEDGSTDMLKREALATVATLDQVVEGRRKRHADQFSALAAQLKPATRELEDARRLSTLDALTELPNRKAFDDYVSRTIELHTLVQQPTSLLLVDVDEFKIVNDTLGHQVGDEALKAVARALSRTFLRKSDFVCRFAGDEFAAVMQDTTMASAVSVAERLRRTLRDVLISRPESGPRLDFSISVGLAQLEIGDTSTSWFERADRSLYAAKAAGRDRVVIAPEVVTIGTSDQDGDGL
jgi:diguanylate cyclase (GGDEF)-like protein